MFYNGSEDSVMFWRFWNVDGCSKKFQDAPKGFRKF